MALKLADRVRETSTSSGTGNITLAGAVTGFQAFSAVMAIGDTTYYSIVSGAQWETGIGTYASTNTLARTTVLESSNSGGLVNFPAGALDVFVTLPASKASTEFASEAEAVAGTAIDKPLNALGVAQAITARVPSTEPVTFSANASLQITSANRTLVFNSSGTDGTFTIPSESSVNFPVGTRVTLINPGVYPNSVIVKPATGVSILTSGFLSVLPASQAQLVKTGANQWFMQNGSIYLNSPMLVGVPENKTAGASSAPELTETNDLLLLFVETAAQAVSAPSGYSVIPGLPQTTGTAGGAAATSLYGFYRIATGSSADKIPQIANPGDHRVAFSFCVKNVDPVNPFGATAGNVAGTATAAVSMPTVTTTRNDNLIMSVVAYATNAATDQFLGATNAGLSRLTTAFEGRTTTGNGGGFAIITGVKSSPGAISTTAGTLATASVQARWTGAINPAS